MLLFTLFLGWICSTFHEFISLIQVFILLFVVYAWVLLFDDVSRILTSLARHLTFNELEMKSSRLPLTCHGRGRREETRQRGLEEPRAAHGGGHGPL